MTAADDVVEVREEQLLPQVLEFRRRVGVPRSRGNRRKAFGAIERLLRRPVAYMIYAPPGSQKSFVLEHLVAELNREEVKKSEPVQAAFYVYAIGQMTPSQLMKAVAIACGTSSAGDRMRIARNLAHDFQGRRALLVVDEA